MTPYTFTESEVEEAALAWLAGFGYLFLSGSSISLNYLSQPSEDQATRGVLALPGGPRGMSPRVAAIGASSDLAAVKNR